MPMPNTTIKNKKIKCKNCKKTIAKSIIPIKCETCNNLFHKKCSTKNSRETFVCKPCLVPTRNSPIKTPKIKCLHCKKTIAKSIIPINCTHCGGTFHKKCSIGNSDQQYTCKPYSFRALPLYDLNDDKFLSTLNALDNIVSDNLNILPSFSIKSKLDKFPGHISFQTGENLAKNITSRYVTPMEFTKIKKRH